MRDKNFINYDELEENGLEELDDFDYDDDIDELEYDEEGY
jgi:hypothetical protein